MSAITIITRSGSVWASELAEALRQASGGGKCHFLEIDNLCDSRSAVDSQANHVYVPSTVDRAGMMPDLCEAERVFQPCAQTRPGRFVILSSALIYGTGTARQAMVGEDFSAPGGGGEISSRWKSFEALANQHLQGRVQFTILRPTTVLPSPALLSRRLAHGFAVTLAGHDPTVQLLSMQDLAGAILRAVSAERTGVFNVAPNRVIPLHAAIHFAGKVRIPWPRSLQKLATDAEALEYLRYPWTVSDQRIKEELGFAPQQTSLATVVAHRRQQAPARAVPEPQFDEFGMDHEYIEFYGKTLFKFLSRYYWRIEAKGLENIPAEGPAVLVGTHRGFMPWDAVMALHLLVEKTRRTPRFLTHPGLLKFPFISSFVTKMGGVVACQESADRVLANGELLGVFPEGVQGGFTTYRKAYQLLGFGRDSFAKLALRYRAPIIPFVNVGSAEALPIFKQIKSRRWTRYSDWPCLPISTFPLLPIPLPTKWHIQFLPPIQTEPQGPQADMDLTAKGISQEVRRQMQQAIDDILRRRRSVFWGSVF